MANERREIENLYEKYCPAEWKMPPRDAVWVYDFRIRGISQELQNRIVKALLEKGIPARHGFKPMSEQEEYKTCRVIGSGNAKRLASEVVYLPVQPGVTTEATARLAFGIIKQLVAAYSR